MDALWQGTPPRTARKNIQVYISALRKMLFGIGAGDRLVHRTGGYLLHVGEDELDSLRFQNLVRAAREASANGAFAPASRLLRQAMDLWQGSPLNELRFSQTVQHEAERLDQRYLQAYEDWAEVELRLGNALQVADTVGDLVERYPERERLRAVQMNALFSRGRQTEALAVYESVRRMLASEYGLRPSPALESLYRSMLSGGPQGSGGPLAPGGPFAPGGRDAGRAPRQALRTLLPQDLPDFTGRAAHLRELFSALSSDRERRLLLLTGPVGAGKTALAAHAAHQLADVFPDGRVLVRMRDADGRPRSVASVLGELTRYAGFPGHEGAETRDAEETAAAWRVWLSHRGVLVVLDDAVDEACVRPLVPDTGDSAVLVTARTQLAGLVSAERLEVAPFDESECLELLARIIGHDRLRSGLQAARRIGAATGRLPLAVRASGLKLAVRRHLPLDEYAWRLADGRTVLDELVAGDMNVRSRLASGWRDLSAGDRHTLRMLGGLPDGPFTLWQATAHLTCGPDDARCMLESLMDAGVILAPSCEVTSHAASYELPRLMQVYAREQALLEAPRLSGVTA